MGGYLEPHPASKPPSAAGRVEHRAAVPVCDRVVQTGGSDMLKVLGIAILVIFIIGLLVVIGAFDLIL
jgi:hypothetical protein